MASNHNNNNNNTISLTLEAGGERLHDINLEVDGIVSRWQEAFTNATALAAANTTTTTATTTATPSPSLEITVILRERSWTVAAMEKMVPLLQQMAPHVVALEADDIIAQRETTEGYKIIQLLTEALQQQQQQHDDNNNHEAASWKLARVNFNDNALGPPSLQRIRNLLHPRVTKSVTFLNCGVDTECMKILKESLLLQQSDQEDTRHDGATCCCVLQELILSRNTIGPEGAQHIGTLLAHCPDLQVFIYTGTRPGIEGSYSIAMGLQQQLALLRERDHDNHSPVVLPMRELNVSEGSFGSDATTTAALCEALAHMPHLERLQLQDCGLELSGLQQVMTALTTAHAPLMELNLGMYEKCMRVCVSICVGVCTDESDRHHSLYSNIYRRRGGDWSSGWNALGQMFPGTWLFDHHLTNLILGRQQFGLERTWCLGTFFHQLCYTSYRQFGSQRTGSFGGGCSFDHSSRKHSVMDHSIVA